MLKALLLGGLVGADHGAHAAALAERIVDGGHSFVIVHNSGLKGARLHAQPAEAAQSLLDPDRGSTLAERVLREEGGSAHRRSLALHDRLVQETRRVRQPRHVHPPAQVQRLHLRVLFHEETPPVHTYPQLPRQLPRLFGLDAGAQHHRIRLERELLPRHRLAQPDLELFSPPGHPRLGRQVVAEEDDAGLARRAVVLLPEPKGAHVAVEEVHLRPRVGRLQPQRVLHRLRAADARAVGPLLLPAPRALDHHHALQLRRAGHLLQLPLRQHAGVLPVQVLPRPRRLAPRGDDDGAMRHLLLGVAGSNAGEVGAGAALDGAHLAFEVEVDEGVGSDAPADAGEGSLGVGAVGLVADRAPLTAELGVALDEVDVEPEAGEGEGGGHAGGAAADDEGALGKRLAAAGGEGVEPAHGGQGGHGHSDERLGLAGQGTSGVWVEDLLSEADPPEEAVVEAGAAQGGLVLAGVEVSVAPGDDDAVEHLGVDGGGDRLPGRDRLGDNDARQAAGVGQDLLGGEVPVGAAQKDPDARLFLGQGTGWGGPLPVRERGG